MISPAVALLLGGGLLGIAVSIEERRRRAPSPGAAHAATPADGSYDAAEVTVLLPVRNEEDNLRPCVEALLALSGRPAVRIVDDGSSDATAARAAGIAAAAGAAPPSAARHPICLLEAGPLPAGWRGKVHALSAGARGVESTWLLLTDADVRVQPAALERALAAAAHWHLDAISLAGRQQAQGLAENLVMPAVFALLDALLGDWEAAAASGGAPVANGQFLLLRRAALESSGSFEGVRGAAIDDVAIVTAMRRQGYRTGFFRAPDLLSIRMYRGWTEVTRGWRRNLGGLLGERPGATCGALAILVLPAMVIGASLAAGRGLAALTMWSAGVAASGLLRAGSGHRTAYALLYPVDALLLGWLLAAGYRDRRRGRLLSWKGREMKV